MSFRQVDYLIVGQGLAGSCLALQLIIRNKSVFVFDQPTQNRASSIAAGLFNPVTGKLMSKTWMADRLFTYLHEFYSNSESQLESKFFHPFPLYRPFISIEEQNEWMGKSAEPEMMDYIAEVFTSGVYSSEVKDPFGGLLLKNCGYLDVPSFIKATRNLLVKKESFREENFNEVAIEFDGDTISYEDLKASKIIFCNGTQSLNNHFFKDVPIRPLKGETLSVAIDQSMQRIYNRGVYVVPSPEKGIFKVGATYNTKDKTEGTSEGGRTELIEKLNSLIKVSFRETGGDWGFRPTTPDRRPILGAHPAHPNLVMFNGLGTKGVSLAPYFSHHLADWITGVSKIDKLVDILRYY